MDELTLSKVLQDLPPGLYSDVKNVLREGIKGYGDEKFIALQTPELYLYCDNDKCKGVRLFEHNVFPFHYDDIPVESDDTCENNVYVEYMCQNCKDTVKSYFLIVDLIEGDKTSANIIKAGEFPFYGPNIPSKLISLIGPDRELFLKGRKAESMNLGIGSFTYYRRVIENQKNRLIDNIISVSKKLGVKQETIEKLEEGKKETQFSTAISHIKSYLPQQLYINNHNPLLLLHKALSVGVHNLDDEQCLEYAHSIRIVLTEFSDRLAEILRDHNELKEAIKKLKELD